LDARLQLHAEVAHFGSLHAMLITDRDYIAMSDLLAIDPEIGSVSMANKIVVDGPNSIIRKGIEEIGITLTARFQNFSGYLIGLGVSSNHAAAVFNTLSTSVSRPRMKLTQVVAVSPDPSKLQFMTWTQYHILYLFYRAAFSRKIDDRFEKKMNLYKDEAARYWGYLEATGIPVVTSPLPCPGAIREFNSGSWGSANVTCGGAGSDEQGASYSVAITWVNVPKYQSYANTGNGESGPSAFVEATPLAGQVITASITGLNPPNGMAAKIGVSDGVYSPLQATHWNVYVGRDGDQNLWLQNANPIPVGTQSFTLPNAPLLSGNALISGQSEDFNYAFQNVLSRA
jgi:hypothetical protein